MGEEATGAAGVSRTALDDVKANLSAWRQRWCPRARMVAGGTEGDGSAVASSGNFSKNPRRCQDITDRRDSVSQESHKHTGSDWGSSVSAATRPTFHLERANPSADGDDATQRVGDPTGSIAEACRSRLHLYFSKKKRNPHFQGKIQSREALTAGGRDESRRGRHVNPARDAFLADDPRRTIIRKYLRGPQMPNKTTSRPLVPRVIPAREANVELRERPPGGASLPGLARRPLP